MSSSSTSQIVDTGQVPFAPGVTVEVRDEEWLVTAVERAASSPSTGGSAYLLKVRGVSPYVRDTTASFYTDLDEVKPLDPSESTVVADPSPGYRRSRLWLESTLRRTPVPLYDESLVVSTQMLADHLDYQLSAVRKALSNEMLRPRLLIADAVGLGKTLEIGMILAELIRRGRGDRILVVTPRHVLEQMQQELWTRFAIPLVRLDSMGIQKVRRTLPATRNPFTFFPRVIVSIDTLKSAKYRAQLERVRWDAVVIDEVHNATNAATQNNELARLLAPTTEALILASATPHNGRAESFAELIRLLDPTAVGPDGTINPRDLQPLIIRRHRHSPEVDDEVGSQWAVRAEPNNILVPASPQETALARELRDTWTRPGVQPPSGDNRLFPWTLAKAYLSSPAALIESVTNRRKNASGPVELAALDRLQDLAEQVTPASSAKYQRLLAYLREIGISPRGDQRVVIFSERVRTLHWLAENLAKDLKLKSGAVAVMHGGLSDQEQMDLVDGFKRAASPLRVLVTGDVASEGVNLHTQCHHLVHFDIPWSLIRIQQRNGRVDRYGQRTPPVITTLLLDPPEDAAPGDLPAESPMPTFVALMIIEDSSTAVFSSASSARSWSVKRVPVLSDRASSVWRISSNSGFIRLNTRTCAAPSSAACVHSADAAPPVPSRRIVAPSTGVPTARISLRRPAPSVLSPYTLPSLNVSVLTAFISLATSDISSRYASASLLKGIVRFAPA